MPFVQWYRKTRGIIRQGLRADQPPVADVLEGTLYGVTDEGDIIERSDGSAWQPYSPTGSGDVVGPAGATADALARFDGVTGLLLKDSPVTLSDGGAFTLPDDVRQVFNPGANAAGLNVGAHAGDPGTPVDGDVWYDSSGNALKARINGATVSLGAGGGSLPVVQTTTATGTQNDFDLTVGRSVLLRCNNASALVITGFEVGGVNPQEGDTVIVSNVGTSTVRVAHQNGGSDDENRCIFPSTNGQILGAGGSMTLVYDGTSLRWRMVDVEPGLSIAVPFNAGDFSGTGSMTVTVDAGDVRTFRYSQRGAQVTIALALADFTTGGTPDTTLIILLPNGFTAANQGTVAVYAYGRGRNNGGSFQGIVGYTAASVPTELRVDKFDASTWANGTNNNDIQGSLTIFVD